MLNGGRRRIPRCRRRGFASRRTRGTGTKTGRRREHYCCRLRRRDWALHGSGTGSRWSRRRRTMRGKGWSETSGRRQGDRPPERCRLSSVSRNHSSMRRLYLNRCFVSALNAQYCVTCASNRGGVVRTGVVINLMGDGALRTRKREEKNPRHCWWRWR